jgi:pimeloyl-ACP methyl ester carboxylesterase
VVQQFGQQLETFGAEVARRRALTFAPRPQGVRGPSWPRLLGELGTPLAHWQAARQGGEAPEHPGVPSAAGSRPVMLLPGFGAHPARMKPLRTALEAVGHRVSDWGLGFNFGPSEDRFARLAERVEVMARREGAPLVLVGWSLGGLFARQLAKALPDQVGLVITMGTPFSGDRRANNAWRAYQLVAGHSVDEAPMGEDLAVKPPVPTVALWSPRDGFIAPRCAAGWPGERDLAVALRCTHLGFAAHPQVARTLVELIARH